LRGHPHEAQIRGKLDELAAKGIIRVLPDGADTWNLRLSRPLALRGGAPVAPKSLSLEDENGGSIPIKVGSAYREILADSDDVADQIQESLERESRWRVLAGLRNEDPSNSVRVEVRVIPVQVRHDATGEVLRDNQGQPIIEGEHPALRTPHPVFAVGDFFVLEVKNISEQPEYVTVLDLRTDRLVGPVWPDPRYPSENLLQAGELRRIRWPDNTPYVFKVVAPTGMEIFKAIATREKTNFSPLVDLETLQTRGGPPKGQDPGAEEAESPLGKLLLDAMTRQRSVNGKLSPTYWATYNRGFSVVLPGTNRSKP
jgi:hypothetical protein